MIINHNIAALNTHRQMGQAQSAQMESMEKLSSGLRINSASDDAAGLTISEKMRGQIRGLEKASTNAQDGISMIQTAEGALSETHDILQRMRELSVQAANGTNTADDRGEIQKEIDQLTEEVDRIANSTEFNSTKLLTGNLGVDVQDGTKLSNVSKTASTQAGTLTIGGADATSLATTATTGSITTNTNGFMNASGSITINGATMNVTTNTKVDDVADWVNSNVTGAKATYNDSTNEITFESTATGSDAKLELETSVASLFSAGGDDYSSTNALTDAEAGALNGADVNLAGVSFTDSEGDLASFATEGNKVTITSGSQKGLEFSIKDLAIDNQSITVGGDISLHIGANENQTVSVSIDAMDSNALGVEDIDVTTPAGAEKAITLIDNAIKSVSSERSKLGATQNRLDHTINNLNTSAENLTAAESRIRDVDYTEAA
ncbi:flagellin [Planococcus sp. A6]|uniref:flagellin N-terminal helical domain-containing protein n=1 Tax=Planococcus sp. A6 TaxID=2992760 RepID=UPI00237B6E37|nr:flagellin [Planococcus sp. A6]